MNAVQRSAPRAVLAAFTIAGCTPDLTSADGVAFGVSHRHLELPPGRPDEAAVHVDFERFSVTLRNPTALSFGPDGRLYVATLTGVIHALRFDYDAEQLLDDQLIESVANRRLLGLALDPESTPDELSLWVRHSDLLERSGAANSGTVSRLSGPDFSVRRDVVVGLPGALVEQSTNGIRFGPDGLLYLSQAANTAAGAPNDGASGFGLRPEQPLSAALLIADVKAPGFDGDCLPLQDADGRLMDRSGIALRDVECDVRVFASGLRDSFDAVFHSNGQVYATDNGVAGGGTFPDLGAAPLAWHPSDGCDGPVLGAGFSGHDPGMRPNLLLRLEQDGYYGHPNPSRNECVFYAANPTSAPDAAIAEAGGGRTALESNRYPTGMQPDERYRPAMFSFGEQTSPKGLLEYRSNAFCGALKGDLLVNASSPAQVWRLSLNADGTRVSGEAPLARSTPATGGATLVDPLGIAQDPLGRLYVGEFGAGRINVFQPASGGCWQEDGVSDLPLALLDAGGAELSGEIYVVAGKTKDEHRRGTFIYDPLRERWRPGPGLPASYPPVENPAVVALNGALYVFGGSTEAFDGAVTNAAKFDPRTQTWTTIAPLPEPRGGATVQTLGGRIYLAGGMHQGRSRAELFIYDPLTDAWSAGAPLRSPRDNPMSAAASGRLLVFGGRVLDAPGIRDNGALDSAEAYDLAADRWSPIASMPTGRRTGNAVAVRDRVLLFGGEGHGTLPQNELYDPSADTWSVLPDMPRARHGAVAARLGNGVYVVAGGPVQGSSFTSDVDVFRFR